MCYVLNCCVFHPDGRFYGASTELKKMPNNLSRFFFALKSDTQIRAHRQTRDSQLSGQKESIDDRAAEYETVKHSLSMIFIGLILCSYIMKTLQCFENKIFYIFSFFFFSSNLSWERVRGIKPVTYLPVAICTIYAKYVCITNSKRYIKLGTELE